jgi:F420 biosynthesis protein FbiB-like protein
LISTDDLHTFLRSRRSVRRFRPDPVPDSALERILDTATHAPSAHNRQPWRFRVITSARTKSCLADAMGSDFQHDLAADGVSQEKIDAQVKRSRERILSAPVVILLCMDLSHMDAYPDPRRAGAERTMAIQSVAAAGSHLLLAAHAEGLGAVWVCSPLFTPQTIQRVLNLPVAWEPQAMFFVGYSDGVSKPKNLRALPEIALFDQG